MQYPASLLVLTANTLYKACVFLFCFLKNKQAKPPTFPRRRKAKFNTTSQEFTETWAKKEDKAGL